MVRRGPKGKRCQVCGERLSGSAKGSVEGFYCRPCYRERARKLKAGTLKPKFVPRVRVLIDKKTGERSLIG